MITDYINVDLIGLGFAIVFTTFLFCVLVYATIYPFYIYPYKCKRNSKWYNAEKKK